VLEHYDNVVVVEAPFEWDDIGNWSALPRLRGADSEGNTIDATHLGIQTRNTIVRGEPDHLIVTVGLNDCIVVQTPDATLVASRHDENALRKIVEELERRTWTRYL
jgi:mannose-1-phosphate guanylyltransferase